MSSTIFNYSSLFHYRFQALEIDAHHRLPSAMYMYGVIGMDPSFTLLFAYLLRRLISLLRFPIAIIPGSGEFSSWVLLSFLLRSFFALYSSCPLTAANILVLLLCRGACLVAVIVVASFLRIRVNLPFYILLGYSIGNFFVQALSIFVVIQSLLRPLLCLRLYFGPFSIQSQTAYFLPNCFGFLLAVVLSLCMCGLGGVFCTCYKVYSALRLRNWE